VFIPPTSPLMQRLRGLFVGRGDPSAVHPLAGLYCTLGQVTLCALISVSTQAAIVSRHMCVCCVCGQCYDLLDNRPRGVRALAAAVTLDCACTEVPTLPPFLCETLRLATTDPPSSLSFSPQGCRVLGDQGTGHKSEPLPRRP
jgi:hypothetical protein